MVQSFQSDDGISWSILLPLENSTKRNQKSSGCEYLFEVSNYSMITKKTITQKLSRAGYLYIYELDASLFPFFTMSVMDADTTVNCSDPYSLTIQTRRGETEKDLRKDFLVIFVDILGEALRAEHLILSSNNCKVNLRKHSTFFHTYFLE